GGGLDRVTDHLGKRSCTWIPHFAKSLGKPLRRPQCSLIAADRHASLNERENHSGENSKGHIVHQDGLDRIAYTGPLCLGVEHYALRLLLVGGFVDEYVAVARGGVNDGHGGHGLQGSLQALPAARDQQVDRPVLSGEL